MKRVLLPLLLLLPLLSLATTNTCQLKLNQHYKAIDLKKIGYADRIKKHSVIEFFSLGCHACHAAEPAIETWLQHKDKRITFSRIPVVYGKAWEIYAKAYYIAEAFGVENKVVPSLFSLIHDKRQALQETTDYNATFNAAGVDSKQLALSFDSPSIANQLQKDDKFMRAAKIMQIPTMMIDGKYITDASMVSTKPGQNPYQAMMHVVNCLLNKDKH